MAKTCMVCNAKIDFSNDPGYVSPEGDVCISCVRQYGLYGTTFRLAGQKPRDWTASQIEERVGLVKSQLAAIESRPWTYKIGNMARFDDVAKRALFCRRHTGFLLPDESEELRYDQIVAFEILENGDSIISGNAGKAVVGALLFGVAGAVVGASAKRKKRDVCTSLLVKLVVKDYASPDFYISLITAETNKQSQAYANAYGIAQKIASKLQLIIDENNSARTPSLPASDDLHSGVDPVQEIRRYKELYDDGIITQEEFEAKKKQLLGI